LPTLRAVNASPETPAPRDFDAEVARIRSSGMFGRSAQLQRLFEFLVQCHATGRIPKEIEVAIDCFDRRPDLDAAQDATVRVSAHKLRRRLEEFYRDAGEAPRLTIPRGEYRLVMPEPEPPLPQAPAGWRRLLPTSARERIAMAIAGLAVLLAVGALAWNFRGSTVQQPSTTLLASPLWAPLLTDDLPIQLVLGDYYIFGERDESGQVQRLVREFDINSRQELEHRVVTDPLRADRYADLNLAYLPTSSAQALREVLPVVTASGKPVMLTLASELDPATLKTTHVVYLGYLSALGMMEDLVLGTSRYSIGGSYDELVDSVTGEARVSEAGEQHPAGVRYRDYAYLATLKGPGGHMHLVIAGTRDIGLMQAAEVVADPERLGELNGHLAGSGPFEALYEVEGINGVNVDAHLLEAGRADP
jgi:hypothetical protein